MKKVIGILSVAVFAVTLFFNSNTVTKSDTSLDLASLITMSTANAEAPCINDPQYYPDEKLVASAAYSYKYTNSITGKIQWSKTPLSLGLNWTLEMNYSATIKNCEYNDGTCCDQTLIG